MFAIAQCTCTCSALWWDRLRRKVGEGLAVLLVHSTVAEKGGGEQWLKWGLIHFSTCAQNPSVNYIPLDSRLPLNYCRKIKTRTMHYIRLYFYPEIDFSRAWQRRFFVRLLILCQQYCAFSPQLIIRIYQAKLYLSYFHQTRVQSLTWLISKSAVCHCSLSKLLHEFS